MKTDPNPVGEQDQTPLDDEEQTDKPKGKKSDDIVGDDGVIRLSLKRQEIPVELEDPDTGETMNCVLRELSGKQRDAYLNNLGNRVRTNREGKVTGIKQFDGLQAGMLTKCLFRIDEEDKEKAISEGDIQKFPARIQTQLFDKAKEISGMNEEAETDAGND